jgi:hypothetical protein
MQINRLQEEQQTREEIHSAHIGAAKDIAFKEGKVAAHDEVSLEVQKLRDLIENMRSESSNKSKRLIELQFEVEELQKSKRKSMDELADAGERLKKEREA